MSGSSEPTLIVFGSLTQNEEDRLHNADSLVPVQALDAGRFVPVDLKWPSALGASTGTVFGDGVALASQQTVHVPGDVIDGLDDVHELSVDGDLLWIPNTGTNELLSLSTRGEVDRRSLGEGYHHANQVFRCAAGELWALVHHVHGRQFLRRVAGRVLKSQGDGGLLHIDGGRPRELQLAAPHSARVINGENWILDSGRALVRRYAADWTELDSIAVGGWGRGAYVTPDETLLYIGLSPLRRRYQSVSQEPAVERPEVHVIDIERRTVIDKLPVFGIDQINGLMFAPVELVSACMRPTAPRSDVGASRSPVSESVDE